LTGSVPCRGRENRAAAQGPLAHLRACWL
jgi:hypothetical protein